MSHLKSTDTVAPVPYESTNGILHMAHTTQKYRSRASCMGFTLIELLVVIAIIGILSTVVFFAINDARVQSRDKARGIQLTELMKALELTYSNDGVYPEDGTPVDNSTGDILSNVGSGFIGGQFMSKLPEQPERYQYCVSADRTSYLLAIDTENDRGSIMEYCGVTRGAGAGPEGYGCTVWMNSNALESCLDRF